MLQRYRSVLLVLLLLALARPVSAQEVEAHPAGFEPWSWRPESPWDHLWSTRWEAGLFHSERLSLRSWRGGLADQIAVDTGLGLLVATRNIQDIPILPPRYYTTEEYAHYAMAVQFGKSWRSETLRTVHGDPTLAGQRQAQGGLVNLELPVELPGFAQSIFGEGAPNLRISGSERITIGGTSSWQTPVRSV